MNSAYSLPDLARIVGGTLRGPDDGRTIRGVNSVSDATPDEATWVTSAKYEGRLPESCAGVVLVASGFGPTPMPAIECLRVDRSVAALLGAFRGEECTAPPGIHPQARVDATAQVAGTASIGPFSVVAPRARIGKRTVVGPGVFIGPDVVLGEDCRLGPNVCVEQGCFLGNRVRVHACSVIGSEGFGYYFDGGKYHRVPHIGIVRVEDDVEIGACCCVDRAKFAATVVGAGTKIDNLVQVAHNVRIGEHGIIAGQTGLAGSATLGRYCVLGGRAGVLDNVSVGDRARFAGGATVATKDVPAEMTVSGYPAQDHRAELRAEASRRRLPELVEQVRELLRRVERLEASADDRKGR